MAQQWWEAAPVVKSADAVRSAPSGDARGAVEFAAPVDATSPAEATRLEIAKRAETRAEANDIRAIARDEYQMNKPTQEQGQAGFLVARIKGGIEDINGVLQKSPQSQQPGLAEGLRGGLSPEGFTGLVTRQLAEPERRAVADAQSDMLDAVLTLATGAAYTKEQLQGMSGSYFPQYGDTPEEIDIKNRRLLRAVEAAKLRAGPLASQLDDVANMFREKTTAEQPEALVTAPGTTRAAAMGAVTPGEPVMTDEDMAAGRAIQDAWNATGKFEDVARVASQFGRSFGEEEAAFLRANEGKPVNINANATGTPTATQEAIGEFVATPGGESVAAGAVGAANAASLGMLDELAPILGLDAQRVQMAKDYLRNKAPISSFAGEMVGALPAAAAMSSGAGALLGGTRLASAAPMLGDVAFGSALAGGEAPEGQRTIAALTGGATAGLAGAAGRRLFGGGTGAGGAGDGGAMPPGGGGMASGGRASGGAAATPDDVIRVTRSQELPVPIQLANFQKSRAFEQQQRARELAKNNEVGGPIRELFAEQQRALAGNFDAFLEKTGSEIWQQAEEQGVRITAGIKKMADQSKAKYRALYKRAETSGETREPVGYDELRAYIAEQTPTTREQLAPVLRAVNEQLTKNDAAGTGQMTLQQLEDVRKLINKTVEPGTPNSVYGGEMKAIIDGITENAGGDVYKAARAARREHAVLFDEVGTIAQLLGTKRNSSDRVVAAEQVVDKLVSSATPAASLRKLRDLVTGDGGDPQAWKEVQGAAIERIRNAAYPPGAAIDESGARVVSVAGLRRMVDQLDKAGKLDVIFDYQTANGLRTIADVAQDVFTAPPGAVNSSGTSSALLNALDMIINFGVAGIPIPGGVVNNVLKPIAGRVRNRDMRKEVKQLIGEPAQ